LSAGFITAPSKRLFEMMKALGAASHRDLPSTAKEEITKLPIVACVADGTRVEVGMPLFFIVTIAAATILLGTTAADGRWWQSSHAAVSQSFDPSSHRTVAECLRVAHQAAAPSSACASNR
jgi:hypothetical protein